MTLITTLKITSPQDQEPPTSLPKFRHIVGERTQIKNVTVEDDSIYAFFHWGGDFDRSHDESGKRGRELNYERRNRNWKGNGIIQLSLKSSSEVNKGVGGILEKGFRFGPSSVRSAT